MKRLLQDIQVVVSDFKRLRTVEFDVQDQVRNRKPKVYYDAQLEAIFKENPYQTQNDLVLTLRFIQQAILQCL